MEIPEDIKEIATQTYDITNVLNLPSSRVNPNLSIWKSQVKTVSETSNSGPLLKFERIPVRGLPPSLAYTFKSVLEEMEKNHLLKEPLVK
ncbi:MAG: hypothetical protein ACXAD7_13825 [Candidatus Kariarchaeaceae archaeon]